jgi:hypothetical protein
VSLQQDGRCCCNDLTASLTPEDVWPNPVSDVLNIDFSIHASSGRALEVTVVDASGKEILRFTQNDSREVIDVSSWPSGIYILNGTDDKGRSFSVKVVKQ